METLFLSELQFGSMNWDSFEFSVKNAITKAHLQKGGGGGVTTTFFFK